MSLNTMVGFALPGILLSILDKPFASEEAQIRPCNTQSNNLLGQIQAIRHETAICDVLPGDGAHKKV